MAIRKNRQVRQTGGVTLRYAVSGKAVVVIDYGTSVKTTSDNGSTPLHLAAQDSRTEAMKELIRRGAGINPPDQAGDAPCDGWPPSFTDDRRRHYERSGFRTMDIHDMARAIDIEPPCRVSHQSGLNHRFCSTFPSIHVSSGSGARQDRHSSPSSPCSSCSERDRCCHVQSIRFARK